MSTIEESIEVHVPVRTAYNQWTQFEVEPEGITEQVGDKLGFVKRRAKGDLERFKDLIESRGRETGAWRGEVEQDPTS
jgi:hypothetical protein